MSVWTMHMNDPNTIPTDASESIAGVDHDAPHGKNGIAKRTNPYVPIFRRTPARMTEPAVGASTCASGSQVWNGNIGTLIMNDSAKAQNSRTSVQPETWPGRSCWRLAMSN